MHLDPEPFTETSSVEIRTASRLCFFGVGVQVRECYRQLVLTLGREPDAFCDNDSDKWGKSIFNKPCITPADLKAWDERAAVVITVRRYEDIALQLREIGIRNVFVACFDRGYDIVSGIKPLGSGGSLPMLTGMPVRGRWVLVTGASRGIGRQIALAMAGLGANIVVHSRAIEHTRAVIEACHASGVDAVPIAADLAQPEEVEVMLERLLGEFPAIDIVFNNAGISRAPAEGAWNVSSADYLAHYAVNAVAPIRICYRMIPPMIQRGFGRVVNVSSTIQKRPGEMAYACSKVALSKFVYDLAPSLYGTGVMISLVCPGHVKSDMGGVGAPHAVESVVPGALLGALLDGDINGRWFIAQDYAGLSLPAAIQKAKFYYSHEG
jgi:3-oxoacyl-[acyl-carrier protein] reductase